jgi:predicted lipoprotein with Yx(FWY)xxD motif
VKSQHEFLDVSRTVTASAYSAWWRLTRLIGGALLVATGAVHLDLYLTGYRTIPSIGWLFLVQVISAMGLAAAVVTFDNRLVSAAGAGLNMATLVGYVLSLRIGLLGFREVRTTAGELAGVIEIVGFVALTAFALRPYRHDAPAGVTDRGRHSNVRPRVMVRSARWVCAVLAVLAGASLGISLDVARTASPSAVGSGVVVKFANIHGVAVLTNARGYTLYWFAPDSSTTSACYGTCAAYWPPLIGRPEPGTGVVGKFATIKRSGGALQITYDSHPLYTYVGDSAPGQANGNRIKLNGGWWYEMKMLR